MAVTDADVLALAASSAAGAGFRWDDTTLFVALDPPGTDRAERWGVVVPLPSSPALKPWLHHEPDDAAEWLGMLKTFTDEEVLTGAVEWAEHVEERGVRRFVLAPYGFLRADRNEHERLLAHAGPGGWHQDAHGRFR